jgi:hypothetical protein
MSLAYYWDEPSEDKYWFTCCRDCDWESDMVAARDDLTICACESCGSENLSDDWEWA